MKTKMTVARKDKVMERFAAGASIAEIADWFDQPVLRIEGIIRERVWAAEQRIIELATKKVIENG